MRLDFLIARQFPELSRSIATRLIRDGIVQAGNTHRKPGYRVRTGDLVSGEIPASAPFELIPEPLPLDIVHEDHDILVINKAPGMVVHPSPGHLSGTLANALRHYYPGAALQTPDDFRPGIVHRLDRDTSGLLVVARTDSAYHHLIRQFKDRSVKKTYLGFVFGAFSEEDGCIRLPVGRHDRDRKKMTAVAVSSNARQAVTCFRVARRYPGITLAEFDLKTGRTHQIRVHCAAIGNPIVGDSLYGPKRPLLRFKDHPHAAALIRTVSRHLLHAWQIEFTHPETGSRMRFTAPLPPDMTAFREQFEALE